MFEVASATGSGVFAAIGHVVSKLGFCHCIDGFRVACRVGGEVLVDWWFRSGGGTHCELSIMTFRAVGEYGRR